MIVLSSCVNDKKTEASKAEISIKPNDDIIKDIDGNSYKTININGTKWFQENLRVTHYNNGTPIDNLIKDSDWNSSDQGAFCAFNNQSSTIEKMGLLYNLFAIIDDRKICPDGFHIANKKDWKTISTDAYLQEIQPSILSNPLFNYYVLGWRRSADDDNANENMEVIENDDFETNSFFLETDFSDGGSMPYWIDGYYRDEDNSTETQKDSIKRGFVIGGGGEYYWGYPNDGYVCRCVENK